MTSWPRFCLPLILLCGVPAPAQSRATRPEKVPTGVAITPTAARGAVFERLNPDLPEMGSYEADHPVTTAVSPDGTTLLVLTTGYNRNHDDQNKDIPGLSNEYVFVYDIRQSRPVKHQVLQIPNTYMGIAWAPDGSHFYVAGGSNDNVHVFGKSGNRWVESGGPIPLGHNAGLGIKTKPVAAGLAVNQSGTRLLVANYENDSVSLVDLSAGKKIAELDLRPGQIDAKEKGVPGGEFPYWVVFKGDRKAYVSSLRDREIVVLDAQDVPRVVNRIKVHGQPGRMILNKDQSLLFATADNSDAVVAVNTETDRVVATIGTTAPAQLFSNRGGFKGSNPDALALSPDEKTLYVANGGTNSVAVIHLAKDIDDSSVAGLIPTGWYPNSVSISADGQMLYIVNGKSNAGPNPKACRNNMATEGPRPCAAEQQFVYQLEKGGLLSLPRPGSAELQQLTLQVARNNGLLPSAQTTKDEALFAFLRRKVRHVIYIVKENRSYDQVLGDLEKGNGDPHLTLFPDALSPNHHDLARRFVILDNFYDSGEVSGNGWNWSTAARATDVVEKEIPPNYAGRGISYEAEGENRGINVGAPTAVDRHLDKAQNPDDLLPGNADVAAPDGPDDESGAGYLWDSALRARLTVRNYGFFCSLDRYNAKNDAGPQIPLLHDPYSSSTRVAMPTKAELWDITDPYYRSFDQSFPDYWRFKEWEREFDDYVKHGDLPNLELIRLPHDHFGNFKEAIDGVNTVETEMADDDYALGLIVQKVARSPYADSTLIFVLEDDAQNGPDHVDAHRSLAYIVGPYVRHGAVVSRYFTTVSMMRTIEEVLGIKALGLPDSVSRPMSAVFSTSQKSWSYTARVPEVLRATQLPLPPAAGGTSPATLTALPRHDAEYWAERTQGFDFSVEDRLDTDKFNLILWQGIKGEGEPYPEERSGADLRRNRGRLLKDASSAGHYAGKTR